MPVFSSVLCAIDRSHLSHRILRHAAGLAGICGARLTILGVSDGDTKEFEAGLRTLCQSALPNDTAYIAEPPHIRIVRVTQGHPGDAIVELAKGDYDVIVAGTHARSGLARWFLGSTSAKLLERAPCATLLIPPGEVEVFSLDRARASLKVGAILAAVDLADHNPLQLELAAQLAALTEHPLAIMTVAPPETSDEDATRQLQEWAAPVAANVSHRFVVRRGTVAEEISRAAVAESAGLVVMGLRGPGRGVPGETVAAVLRSKEALVLAVPPA